MQPTIHLERKGGYILPMLGRNFIKVFDHKFTLKFLGDNSLTPCISQKYITGHKLNTVYFKAGNVSLH
jgi:hypothetical protein